MSRMRGRKKTGSDGLPSFSEDKVFSEGVEIASPTEAGLGSVHKFRLYN